MWTIHTETWGVIQAESVYPSATFPGAITAVGVRKLDGYTWEKIYLFPRDIKVIIPSKEL